MNQQVRREHAHSGRGSHTGRALRGLRFWRALCIPAVLVPALVACGGEGLTPPPRGWIPDTGRPPLDPAYSPSGHAASGDVFVHLFEWPWPSIAAECESRLGPAGYSAVQVSPPQEHIAIGNRPWWERYQPVSYSLERSRSGSGEEFADMVQRCDAVGVGIYVDAVINHMTAGSGTGTAGTAYTKYNYPGLYDADDFHEPCTVNDYQDEENVQDCELLGLADLHTGRASVRETIAAYLIDLVRLGVTGFRMDAAKHMQPVELDSILDRVNDAVVAEGLPRPFYFAEVIDHGGEAVRASDYYGLAHSSGGSADITEFRFRGVGEKFLAAGTQRVAELEGFSATAWGLMPSDKAVVFIQNHDTQRHGGLTYRDPDRYRLAHVWMLAQPYGHPKVMSGYGFDLGSQLGRDAGPPSDPPDAALPMSCPATLEEARNRAWVCEHRDPVITAMVRFRRVVATTPLQDWWDDGAHGIAFSRGDRGFIALNASDQPRTITATTSLPAGTYCDVLDDGTTAGGGCAGRTIEVDEDGALSLDGGPLELPALRAVAIHVEARP